jgi:drug/metabolite transporter (DMT)-like permease
VSRRLRADLALLACTMIWGATFVVIKGALADISVIALLSIRFSLAAAIMAVIYWRAVRALTRQALWAGAQIGFFMFCGYMFQTGGRRVSVWIWLGASAALCGLYFLSVPPQGLSGLNRGDPIVFGCAVAFALHMIFISRGLERHSVAAISFLQVATTAVLATLLLPVAAAAGWERPRVGLRNTLPPPTPRFCSVSSRFSPPSPPSRSARNTSAGACSPAPP